MNRSIKYSKIISKILVVIFLFQSCTIYNFKRSTLDEAVESKKRTKIVLKSGKRLRYKKVIKIDGHYYGIKKKDSISIHPEMIRKIKLKNKTASIISNVLLGGFTLIVIGLFTTDWSSVGSGVGGSL